MTTVDTPESALASKPALPVAPALPPGQISLQSAAQSSVARWLILILISATYTAFSIQLSYHQGRLAAPPILDDVGYFNDCCHRLTDLYEGGVAKVLHGMNVDPPHSLFSTLMGMAAFALFGIHAWPPYVLNGLIVLTLLKVVDNLVDDLPTWQRLLGYGLVLTTQFPGVSVTEFKPDMAWGIASAAAMVATLRKPLWRTGVGRQIGIGAWWGAALIIKASTLPVTAAMFVAAVVLAFACSFRATESEDVLSRQAASRNGDSLPQTFKALCVIALAALIVSAPYYIIDWRQTIGYFVTNALGDRRHWWALKGGFWVQARYYFDGDANTFMLGWHLWVLLAVAGIGAALNFWLRPQTWRRALSLAIVIFVAYLIPTIPEVKGLTLGAAFQALLLLAGVMGLRRIFLALSRFKYRWPAWLFGAALFCFIVPFEMRPPMWTVGDAVTQAFWRTSDGVMETIKREANGENAYITITNEGIVTGYVPLQFRAYEQGLPFAFGNIESYYNQQPPYFNRPAVAPRMRVANYVVASEGGNRDFADFLPTSVDADKALDWLRQARDFEEIASFASQSGKRYFVFANRFCGFGGYDVIAGLTPSFPANLAYPMPAYKAGLHHATRLRILSPAPSEKLLKIVVYNNFQNQKLTVNLDGVVLLDKPLRARALILPNYEAIEVPLHLSAGSHILRLLYTQCNPDGWPAVLYRQLKIVTNPNPPLPTTQP
ncbi:MAG: hypothetical protein M3O30_18940 [Planctomycetota bacterium]|nr:hypothetical protein [Planctomycetota bacterium]